MAMINRLARLFKADFHAVLDQIEEPELLLKQSIREMSEELSKIKTKIKALGFEQENLSEQRKATEKRIDQISDEINVCLSNNNDELARGLIRRKLESAQRRDLITQRQTQTTKSLKELKQLLQEQTSLYDSMQQKFELVCQSSETSNTSNLSAPYKGAHVIADSDIEVALLKEKQAFDEGVGNSKATEVK